VIITGFWFEKRGGGSGGDGENERSGRKKRSVRKEE
jgi:hypothetical protein